MSDTDKTSRETAVSAATTAADAVGADADTLAAIKRAAAAMAVQPDAAAPTEDPADSSDEAGAASAVPPRRDPAEAGLDGEDPAGSPDEADAAPPVDAAPDAGTAAADAAVPATTGETRPAKRRTSADERPDDKPMGIMGHLSELRSRLVRCCIAVGVAFMACYGVSDYLFTQLCAPLVAAMPAGSKLIFTALPEAFFVYLQVGIVAAIFVASPFIFYQIWAFIAPGLYEEEKRFVIPLALISAVLFLLGAAFCYFVVFPFAFTFFIGFANESIAAMPSLQEYLGFALKLLVAFGLICEMPLFTLFLSRMGLVTAQGMRRVRRYAVLVIFIVAAILTPPDVISQMLMALPMIILYEISIVIAVTFGRKPAGDKDDAAKEGEADA